MVHAGVRLPRLALPATAGLQWNLEVPNMRTFRLAATAAFVLIPLVGCSAPIALRGHIPASPTAGKPACKGTVVTIAEGQSLMCDVAPPQRLDIIMPLGDDAIVARCDHMGGELIAD